MLLKPKPRPPIRIHDIGSTKSWVLDPITGKWEIGVQATIPENNLKIFLTSITSIRDSLNKILTTIGEGTIDPPYEYGKILTQDDIPTEEIMLLPTYISANTEYINKISSFLSDEYISNCGGQTGGMVARYSGNSGVATKIPNGFTLCPLPKQGYYQGTIVLPTDGKCKDNYTLQQGVCVMYGKQLVSKALFSKTKKCPAINLKPKPTPKPSLFVDEIPTKEWIANPISGEWIQGPCSINQSGITSLVNAIDENVEAINTILTKINISEIPKIIVQLEATRSKIPPKTKVPVQTLPSQIRNIVARIEEISNYISKCNPGDAGSSDNAGSSGAEGGGTRRKRSMKKSKKTFRNRRS